MKKAAHKPARVGITGNAGKPDFGHAVCESLRLVQEAGCNALCDVKTARAVGLKLPTRRSVVALARDVDLLLVFGGDGTMLSVAREVAGVETPLLGINIGGLGFLASASTSTLGEAFKHVWSGEYALESRSLIEASLQRGRRNWRCLALNDFVISRGHVARLIELSVAVDGKELTCYRGDGLIVSTPTGSTAYSLAAGGALICPTAEVIALTPICPHTLSNRSVIVSLNSTIRVSLSTPQAATIFAADGQLIHDLQTGDAITIRRSTRAIRLMHLEGASFFDTLRHKLHWRGGSL